MSSTTRSLLYFSPDATDAKLFDRVSAFRSVDYDVMTVGFCRSRYDTNQEIDWQHIDLGKAKDGDYLSRIRALGHLFGGLPKMRTHLERSSIQPIVLARNLDMALMARLVLPLLRPAYFVYEVLDIRPAMLSSSRVSKVARHLERNILARADTLWSSSPDFIDRYFQAYQGYDGASELIENKLSEPKLRATTPLLPLPPDGPVRIGWFGTLRCARSLKLICKLAETLEDQVFFDLRGLPKRLGEAGFVEAISRYPNISYNGPYGPQDLPKMFGNIHLSWGFDYSDPSGNSQWLLPNRLYEAGYYLRPVLSDSKHRTGKAVLEQNLGWALDGSHLQDELTKLITSLTPAKFQKAVDRIAAKPESDFSGNQDIVRALAKLEGKP